MEDIDLILGPAAFIIFFAISMMLRARVEDPTIRKYFLPGFIAKMSGAIISGLVYQFYYGGGDTFNFYKIAIVYWNAINNLTLDQVYFLFMIDAGDMRTFLDTDLENYRNSFYSWYYREESAFFVGKLAGFIGFFCYNSYAVISMIFGFLCFTGIWKMYETIVKYCPSKKRNLAFAVLLLPSTIFWGSGLFKDTITLGCLGYLFYGFHKILIEKKFNLIYFIIIGIAAFLTYKVKAYIIICFAPSFMLWAFFQFRNNIENRFIRIFFTPLLLIITLVAGTYFIQTIGLAQNKYALDNVLDTMQSAQEWHTKISDVDKTYSVGEMDGTFTGVISRLPIAVFFALFRPFVWESSGIMLLSALESLGILLLSIYVLTRTKFGNTYKQIIENPVILFCIVFTISLGFIVGLTSYNFGALSRYRMPLLPVYLAGLIILLSKVRDYTEKVQISLPKHITDLGGHKGKYHNQNLDKGDDSSE